ncbi:MAG TPA: ATP-dependent DNA helicase [Actinomycetes bacterium]|nr:ATP-dependent DNA helicase [Actinomycetes bacterium]
MDLEAAFDALPGLRVRDGQRAMARAVGEAAVSGAALLVHAPTGVGKSLAYLLAIAASGRRATVATATKALQSQLVDRDLPRLAEAFGTTFALALGRGNYYCRAKGEALLAATQLAATPQEEAALPLVGWAAGSETGCRTDAPAGTRDDAWELVSTSGEDCPGHRGCALAARCFAEQARRTAREADVVVTNHHLLLLELELRGATAAPGIMLPETDVIVVDEAHRLAGNAAELYGVVLRGSRLGRAGAAVDAAGRAAGRRSDWARRLRGRWEERTAELRPGPVVPGSRAGARVADALGAVAAEVAAVARAVGGIPALGEELEAALHAASRRVAAVARDLVRLARAVGPGDDDGRPGPADLAVWVEEARGGGRVVRSALVEPGQVLRTLLWDRAAARPRRQAPDGAADAGGSADQGGEVAGPGPAGDPAAGADGGSEASGRPATIACSATLAVAGSLEAAARALGVEGPLTLVQGSPFDFARNALLYVPRGVPAPGAAGFEAMVEREVRALVGASGGRALVLCTSWRAVQELVGRLADLPYELLVQGEDGAARLVQRFRDDVASVLVGTRTFFEGIDVPGESLSLLVLDRLPFPPPDDPLLAERGRRAERQGRSRFHEVWLPTAAVSLQQALGRLIRSEQDRGVMAVLDRRLADAAYGAVLRASLPPAPLTRSGDDVRRFFSPGREPATVPAGPGGDEGSP